MEQFSLDCQECGGSALTKACPKCSGVCGQTWRRDLVSVGFSIMVLKLGLVLFHIFTFSYSVMF